MWTKSKKISYLFISIILLILINIEVTGQVNVTFHVDMTYWEELGKFDSESQVVKCVGNFNKREPANAPNMLDIDQDKIYKITYNLERDSSYWYKYLVGKEWGEDESNFRRINVGKNDTALSVVNFDDYIHYGKAKEILVHYIVDMCHEVRNGRFNPQTDSLFLRGEAFGWDRGILSKPNEIDHELYETSALHELRIGQRVPEFKFYYTPGVWEGGDNKTFMLSSKGYNNGIANYVQIFNDLCCGCGYLDNSMSLKITCNTNGAISSITKKSFGSINSVHLIKCMFYDIPNNTTELYPSSIIKLNDEGLSGDEIANDGIYSTNITFPQFSSHRFYYKYVINMNDSTSNEGGNNNENIGREFHYIKIPEDALSGIVRTTFGEMGKHKIENLITKVNKENEIITQYKLFQNYPNPFNPTTIIRFSIPEANKVTIRVYNMLGQEVAELINEYKTVGKYEVSFDASKLSSGMYIYAIQSGSYTATKKMMLIK